MHEETHDRLFAAGWVGVLARWKRDSNLLVTLPATKALCNMDQVGPRLSTQKYASGMQNTFSHL